VLRNHTAPRVKSNERLEIQRLDDDLAIILKDWAQICHLRKRGGTSAAGCELLQGAGPRNAITFVTRTPEGERFSSNLTPDGAIFDGHAGAEAASII
jgi:hypothetical protein